jgi:RNA polymerase sigma-70 factor (ECF subfamily)
VRTVPSIALGGIETDVVDADIAPRQALEAAALDAFVREHHDRLVRLARLVCLDSSEAADAVQGALEQAWRRRSGLRDAAALRSWLDRIVVREAIRLDRRRRSPLGRLIGGVTQIGTELADGRDTLDPTMIALGVAFERLPGDQRMAIALHLYLGYSIAETAGLVGAPQETVRSRLRVGRERLRAALEDRSR